MSKIGDAEDILAEAQSYIECVTESDAIAAVAMAAYQKIGEGIALLDECPEVNPVPAAAKPKARPARTKRKGK